MSKLYKLSQKLDEISCDNALGDLAINSQSFFIVNFPHNKLNFGEGVDLTMLHPLH
uniref:Uncharacterized protein n=1 Tax=Solanum lycopersicum TaxID=4081 RepID=A0A3Q7ID45_SOLLC